jgi:membrane-associated protease RseP (regulator of RpoE activity)
VLSLLLVPVLLGLSMLAQRPLSRWLKVPGPVWPLLPFAPEVPGAHRLAVRGGGALFTLALVLAVLFAQARREQHLTTRVEVGPGMAADQAGVQNGDVITSVDGEHVSDFAQVRDSLLRGAATKRLTLVRGERELELSVTLRDGLLGVKSSGEARETTSLEALRVALRRFVVTPWLLLRALRGDSPVVLSARSPMGPSAWVAAVTVTLTLSWWLMLAVELAALALGALGRK